MNGLCRTAVLCVSDRAQKRAEAMVEGEREGNSHGDNRWGNAGGLYFASRPQGEIVEQ